MVSETSVATAALAIAISALVIAAGQLVAQLFSTADGYRRCQRSVIGDWYKLVELPFRWSSFRYEVKVTTPHFEIATMEECNFQTSFHLSEDKPLPKYPALFRQKKSRYLIPPSNPVALVGDFVSRRGTLCPRSNMEKGGYTLEKTLTCIDIGEDVPTWFDLLGDVHQYQERYGMRSTGPYSESPWKTKDLAPISISRKTRSWDFMPPDIVRPVASTTVGCLITMAYRLGMTWTDFQLDKGIMRAVGEGKSFSTSIVRGMGLVVEYSTSKSYQRHEHRIPDKVADQLTLGIISSAGGLEDLTSAFYFFELRLRDKQLPEAVNLSRGPHSLRISSEAERALETSLSHQDPAHRLPAFTDILGLWCKWLPVETALKNVIDNPFPFPLSTMGERAESRNVWKSELERREATLSEPCKQVLRFYNDWEEYDPYGFKDIPPLRAIYRKAFDAATRYLHTTKGLSHLNMYQCYIPCHVDVNAFSLQQAEENIKSGHDKTRDIASLPDDRDPIFTERAYIYVENVPKFVEEMERRRPSRGKFSYEDVWWMMMMRLHAWTMSVEWVDREGVKIPSEYYDNPARVYIL